MWFRRIGWLLYQLLATLVLLAAAPVLLAGRGRHYLATLRGRLGYLDAADAPPSHPTGGVWVHAVSVGEVGVAATLIARLPQDLPLVVTTVTPTGQARARELFLGSSGDRAVAYLPFDVGFAVRRFFRRFKPSLLILVEGDYWPLILETAQRHEIPVAVVNGRVGERSSRHLRLLPRLSRHLFFDAVHRFAVQTEIDRQRLLAAGAEGERIHVVGNLKFDSTQPLVKPDLEALIRRLAGGRPIILAGSTMLGEDEILLDALLCLEPGRPHLPNRPLLLIAPRHPERFDAVARLARDRSLTCLRRSSVDLSSPEGTASTSDPHDGDGEAADVVLLDTLGELASLYRIADIAFIGGTLVPTGGHNPLEPAQFAVPTVVGPSMENFREMAEHFDRADAWCRVADGEKLAELWEQWLGDPPAARRVGQRAAELLQANRGAIDRTLAVLDPWLPTTQPS
ncbi:MAG: 3-deoxy-D-manno-octulosonic acid transferase [Acidobacteriota bacterium]